MTLHTEVEPVCSQQNGRSHEMSFISVSPRSGFSANLTSWKRFWHSAKARMSVCLFLLGSGRRRFSLFPRCCLRPFDDRILALHGCETPSSSDGGKILPREIGAFLGQESAHSGLK